MLMMAVPIGAICLRLWGCQCADDADADADADDADDDDVDDADDYENNYGDQEIIP